MSAYVHALNGRLRIKIPEIKGSPMRARELEDHFRLLTGMEQVSANPLTGSLLFLYDPDLLTQEEIFGELKEWGHPSLLNLAADNQGIVEKVTATLASGLMEVALTRLVGALI